MAPFKLRFSKMSKSRSKGSRSSSSECDDSVVPQTGTNSRPETPGTEFNVIATGNEAQTNFMNTPPPSYQHVLQETQLRRSPSEGNEDENEYKEEEENEFTAKQQSIEGRNTVSNVQEGEGSLEGSKIIVKAPQIIHKSSKELYRALAKQCGITCKMSDHCRCLDCQSRYFDCEYEKDEHDKTDGGLGAGTPMFIAEVMHGTACALL